jgi:DNA end-binding protein Ku
MRPIWTGSISFGLLQVPVQLFSATHDLDLHFRMLDGRDKKPIRYERVNSDTGAEVPWKQIVRAYEVKKGDYLVVDEAEIKRAAPEQTEAIELEAFVDRCDVDPIYFEKPYFVAPATKAGKGYVVLREALAGSGKIGIARVVIRTRQYLAALHAEKNALMLTLMRFQQELIAPEAVGLDKASLGAHKPRPAELEMAKRLLDSMSVPWKPEAYKDEFRTKLRALLEKRAKHGKTVHETPRTKEKADKDNVIDLVAVLERSLDKHKPRRAHASRRSAR